MKFTRRSFSYVARDDILTSGNITAFNCHLLKVILVKFLVKGGGKTTPRGISASRLARNKIPTTTRMFSGSKFSMVLSVTLPDKTGSQKSKMAAEIM